jgi:hypothetical protein
MGKLTRRQLAGSAAISLVAARVLAQAPAQAPATTNTTQDWDKAALQSHKENSEALAKIEIPMSTEPAFQFKA